MVAQQQNWQEEGADMRVNIIPAGKIRASVTVTRAPTRRRAVTTTKTGSSNTLTTNFVHSSIRGSISATR